MEQHTGILANMKALGHQKLEIVFWRSLNVPKHTLQRGLLVQKIIIRVLHELDKIDNIGIHRLCHIITKKISVNKMLPPMGLEPMDCKSNALTQKGLSY